MAESWNTVVGSTSFYPCLCAANHLSLSIFSIRLGYVDILPSHPKFPFLFLCSVLCTPLSRPWCYPSILIVSTLGPLCVMESCFIGWTPGFSGCLDVRVSSTANIIRFCSPFCCSHSLLCLIPGPQASGMLDTQRASRVSLVWNGFSVVGQWLTPPLPTNLSPSYFPLFIPVFKFIQLLLLFPIISLSCTCAFPRSLRILSLSLLHRLLQRLLPSIHRC